MFLKLKVNTTERIGVDDEAMTDCLVNMDQVQTISPHSGGGGKCKLRFEDGHSLLCGNSIDFIKASVDGTLESGYKAPEPKDA